MLTQFSSVTNRHVVAEIQTVCTTQAYNGIPMRGETLDCVTFFLFISLSYKMTSLISSTQSDI